VIFGYQLGLVHLMWGGIAVFLLLVFELLVGLRKIHFKGRTHMKIHKWSAWVLIGIAALHGVLAMIVFNNWRIF
jgi:fumarate reductase subunit D